MYADKLITLTLTTDEVTRLLLATTTIAHSFNAEAREASDEDLRHSKKRSAAMWGRIHDKIKAQSKEVQSNA